MSNLSLNEKNYKKEGFTLIELLIYIGILIIIMGALIFTLINILFGKSNIAATNQANNNGQIAMHVIENSVSEADAINHPEVGESSDRLELKMPLEENDPIIIEVDDNDRLTLKRGDSDSVFVTSRLVNISGEDLFKNVSHGEGPGTVRVSMEIEFNNPLVAGDEGVFKTNFYSTFNLMKEGLAAGNGEDPEEDCATFEVGDFCGGGHIFYIDDAEEFSWDALIAAPESTEFINKHWGYQGVDIEDEGYPDIRLDGLGDGENASQAWLDYHNSLDPEDQREDKAFLHCEDLVYEDGEQTFDDWFLPTEGELFEMYESLENRATPVGDFCSTDCDYLSSTEYSANNVRAVWFDDGSSSLYNKDYYSDSWPMKIRCVRKWYE